MTSIQDYCILREMKMQKISVFPYFIPTHPKRAKYSNFCIRPMKMTEAIPTKVGTVIIRPPNFMGRLSHKLNMADSRHLKKS